MWISFPQDMGEQIPVFVSGAPPEESLNNDIHLSLGCLESSCSRDFIYLYLQMPEEYFLC